MLKTIESKYGVVIVAGGSGTRFGNEIPKQFLTLNQFPVLMHTIRQFSQSIEKIEIAVVLPANHHETWKKLCAEYDFNIPHHVSYGGTERFYSVKNGLEKVADCELIGIHDGVRPLTPQKLIQQCFESAGRHGSCVPVIPVTDSLRNGNYQQNKPISRENLYRVQTPQVFRQSWIMKAYEQEFDPAFTDDATVLEKLGYPVFLTDGTEKNIKITKPEDLNLAAFYLKEQHT